MRTKLTGRQRTTKALAAALERGEVLYLAPFCCPTTSQILRVRFEAARIQLRLAENGPGIWRYLKPADTIYRIEGE